MDNLFEKPVFLKQGNNPNIAADTLINFINGATKSVHIAIYDFQLEDELESKIIKAINLKAEKGVEIKIAYDHTKANEGSINKSTPENDPAPRGTQAFIIKNFQNIKNVQCVPIEGSHLMHDKYIIKDGNTVLMGSANFTTGAWSFQENNILIINSAELAQHYEDDFNDLWTSGNIINTGINDYGSIKIKDDIIEFAFSPGEGSAAASLFVDAVQGAGDTIWLATMVLSSGPILGALTDFLASGGKIKGIFDETQMRNVEHNWIKTDSPKLAQWIKIRTHLVGKKSTPFSANAIHDFMHNKILLTDNMLVTGSFNLSGNAEKNAENIISSNNKTLIENYKDYIEEIIAMYKK